MMFLQGRQKIHLAFSTARTLDRNPQNAIYAGPKFLNSQSMKVSELSATPLKVDFGRSQDTIKQVGATRPDDNQTKRFGK